MFSRTTCLVWAVWLGGALFSSRAAETQPVPNLDKSPFTLFNPTPAEHLRALSADRPDKTDSPYTVDAGHWQLETDAANYSLTERNPERTRQRFTAFEAGNMNLKLGVLNRVDAQLVTTLYRAERLENHASGTVERHRGFGDLTPRVKINLWGDDGGRTALAVMPFVKFPTAHDGLGHHAIEGGVKIPFAIEVPNWDVSLMTEVDFNRDEMRAGRHAEFVNSISVGRKVIGALSLYTEFYSSVSTEAGSAWAGTVDTWLTYEVNKNLRLDGGIYIGVTRAAEDWHPFLGFTWRY